jgi:hypothetical protein
VSRLPQYLDCWLVFVCKVRNREWRTYLMTAMLTGAVVLARYTGDGPDIVGSVILTELDFLFTSPQLRTKMSEVEVGPSHRGDKVYRTLARSESNNQGIYLKHPYHRVLWS